MTSIENLHIPAAKTFESLDIISRGLKQLKKAKATWRKYKKAEKEGRVTAEQVAAAKAVLRESIADTLEAIIGHTMYLSQCDESDIRERAERNAEEIIA
jgi:hypothetical protein